MKTLAITIVLSFAAFSEAQDCTESANPLGECGTCDTKQLFLAQDCKTGFLCQDTTETGLDGCLKTCGEGQQIAVDVQNQRWDCVNEDDYPCPGGVEFFCPEDPVLTDPELVECDCDWQVHVNGDCTEAIICHSALSGGRQQLTCREGTTISINYLEQQWVCTEGDNCPPNIGGVIMGCPLDPPPVIPGNSTEANCTYTSNPIGDCDGCNQQIFWNEGCDQAFLCSEYAVDDGEDGCLLDCPEGEVVSMNIYNRTWECNERDDDYVCPGYFNTYCPENETAVQCGCAGEVWMSPDCRELYICQGPMSGSEFEGDIFSCSGGQIVSVEFGEEITYQCVDETLETSCPGAFNIGCNGDYAPSSTTAPSTTTAPDGTTTATGGETSLSASLPSLLAAVAFIVWF